MKWRSAAVALAITLWSPVALAQQTNYLGTVFIADPTTPTQQLKVNADGSINATVTGGGTTPGGSNTQVQYNNNGAFGGITGATTNGTTLTLVAPVLGIPASVTLTNATGLPISTGVSGIGSNVAAALGNTAGGAGGFALVGTTPPTGAAGGSLAGTYPNPSLAAINTIATSLAIGGAIIGTDALGVTGTGSISGMWNAGGINLTATVVPANGLSLPVANTLGFSANSSVRFRMSGTDFFSNTAGGPTIRVNAASATAPTIVPNSSNTGDGMGSAGSGLVNIISASLTRAQFGTNAASVSDVLLPGTLFTGGSGTTTFPQMLFQPTGTTAATTWSTSGTIIGANVVSGFSGNFEDYHVAGGASVYKVSSAGNVTAANGTFSGQLNVTAMTQTAVAQSGTVCYNSGTGAVTYDATLGCLASTMAVKKNWKDIPPREALAAVLQMKAGSFEYIDGMGLPGGEQVGLSAQQIEGVDRRLVGYRPNGDLAGVRYQQASALYPMAIQQLNADNDNLRAELRDLQRRVAR